MKVLLLSMLPILLLTGIAASAAQPETAAKELSTDQKLNAMQKERDRWRKTNGDFQFEAKKRSVFELPVAWNGRIHWVQLGYVDVEGTRKTDGAVATGNRVCVLRKENTFPTATDCMSSVDLYSVPDEHVKIDHTARNSVPIKLDPNDRQEVRITPSDAKKFAAMKACEEHNRRECDGFVALFNTEGGWPAYYEIPIEVDDRIYWVPFTISQVILISKAGLFDPERKRQFYLVGFSVRPSKSTMVSAREFFFNSGLYHRPERQFKVEENATSDMPLRLNTQTQGPDR